MRVHLCNPERKIHTELGTSQDEWFVIMTVSAFHNVIMDSCCKVFVNSSLNLTFFPSYNVELNYNFNKYMLRVIVLRF